MNISLYYHILEIGIVSEKGKQEGQLWKFGERKRLRKECEFWKNIIECIKREMAGEDAFDFMFDEMDKMVKDHHITSYSWIVERKDELKKAESYTECNSDDMDFVNCLLTELLHDLSLEIDKRNGKNNVYRLLAVMHNLPRIFYGEDLLGGSKTRITLEDAIAFSMLSMTTEMKGKYRLKG